MIRNRAREWREEVLEESEVQEVLIGGEWVLSTRVKENKNPINGRKRNTVDLEKNEQVVLEMGLHLCFEWYAVGL